ncbi:hypothetical protein TNCV_2781621 [Trichonephila clavipes]|nr:hypothetical protein TNCV_2781621 [Trichonephila clavipes]
MDIYSENSGRDVGGYRFHIVYSKVDHKNSIILRLSDCAGQGRCLTPFILVFDKPLLNNCRCMDYHSGKFNFPAGNKVCIIEWTLSAKISLYFPVVLPFRVTIGSAENHDTAAYIMKEPPPCLIERKQSRSYA